MKGFDEFNTILLPPRQPADKLPQELLDYYEGLFSVQYSRSFGYKHQTWYTYTL